MNIAPKKLLLVLLIAFGSIIHVSSQTPSAEEESDRIVTMLTQEAIATYNIPEDILKNLGTNPGALRKPGTAPRKRGESPLQKKQGYRIQIFSDGRNPSTLQARARARGNAVVAKFPKYRGQVYSFSSAPNWYTRIGNFKTSEEAAKALAELKRAFPAFAAEMRVVKSPITLIR